MPPPPHARRRPPRVCVCVCVCVGGWGCPCQLCINFANEKLHQFFLKFVFKMEEQIYKEEAIGGITIE